jgi:exonuclease VII small subunit
VEDTIEYATQEVDPTLDSGQVEDVGGETAEQAEVDYFDWNEYADKRVKLPVAGEEVEVPLSEALAGYQRQADYTRKTQELSQQRQQVQFAAAIQQALDNDPQGTIKLLQEHYGMNPEMQAFEDDPFADPTEKQIRQLETRIKSFEEAQALQQLERNLGFLQERYGEDFNPNEVVAQALAIGSNDLEGVYKQIAFDRMMSKNQAQQNVVAKKASEEQRIVEQKRQTGIVSGSSGAASVGATEAPVSSLRDAFDLAKRQLGIS